MTRENLNKLKAHIKQQVTDMNWAKNPEGYSYFIGLIRAYNIVEPNDRITEILEPPDVWIEDLEKVAAEQKTEKKSDIEVVQPKIILPGEF
jgi:hypothetical protein